jgi:hypothetical protein
VELTRRGVLALAGMLSGCAVLERGTAPSGVQSVAHWDEQLLVRTDDARQITTVIGPWREGQDAASRLSGVRYAGGVSFEVDIAVTGLGTVRAQAAHDLAGTRHDLRNTSSRDAICLPIPPFCVQTETSTLVLSAAYLERHHADGLTFRLTGKNSDAYVFISGTYVTAVLQRTIGY